MGRETWDFGTRDRATEVWHFENNLKTIADEKASLFAGLFRLFRVFRCSKNHFLLKASNTFAE